jgi:hypothetical protein
MAKAFRPPGAPDHGSEIAVARGASRVPCAACNLERGISRSVAMAMTGHKTESVCRWYAIVSDSDLREPGAGLAAVTMNGDRVVRRQSGPRGGWW